MYQSFVEEMYLAIREIRESTLSAKDKAQALSKLGDSFAKMNKVASLEDPKTYRLSIIKRTLETLLEELKIAGESECLKVIVNLIENHNLTEKLSSLEA